jgi:beta-glucosidase
MFDPPEMVPYASIPITENDTPAHREVALKAARESMVLLKNNGVLPLHGDLKKIAVIGPLADSERVLLGNYHGTPSRAPTVLEGIRRQFPGAHVTFVPGTDFLNQSPVQTSVLITSAETPVPGLKGEYFSSVEPIGTPALTRTDPLVNFDFSESPMPNVEGKRFSARWSGELVPENSGTYQIGVRADDGFRLFLDGKLLVEDTSGASHKVKTTTAPLTLEQGRHYALRLEYMQHGEGKEVKLVWSLGAATTADATKAARAADVVVAVVGINSDLEGEEMEVRVPGFAGGDRTSLDLPAPEEELLRALKSTGKPMIVVLMNGSALAVNWANQNADAILEAWYPGEEGGTAVGETLAGTNNPAGRLPVTFYKSVDQLPPFDDYSMKERTYRYFTGEPLFPFGFGLSYSKFEYQNLNIPAAGRNAPIQIEADVRNVASRAGDEVVELYVTEPASGSPAPVRALKSFQRIHLQPNESRTITFVLKPEQLMGVTANRDRALQTGVYLVSVGGGQPGSASLKGKQVIQGTFTVGHK